MVNDAIPWAGGILHIQPHPGEITKITGLAYIVNKIFHRLVLQIPAITFKTAGHLGACWAVGEHPGFKTPAADIAYPCPTRWKNFDPSNCLRFIESVLMIPITQFPFS